jgi:hypothetical protein
MNQLLNKSHSYATYANAEKALFKMLDGREVTYAILAQADGRFSPVVFATQGEFQEIMDLIRINDYRFGVASR